MKITVKAKVTDDSKNKLGKIESEFQNYQVYLQSGCIRGLRMSRKFPDLLSKLWRGVMWSSSYYVGTAGHVSAETIERYIRDQQTEWKRGSSTG